MAYEQILTEVRGRVGLITMNRPDKLNAMTREAMIAFYPASSSFVTPGTVSGRDAIDAAWQKSLAGEIAPDRGLICKL
mgnify:CR=1 FL=1